jgi:hypothetical protein
LGKITARDVEKIRQYCVEVQGLFTSGYRASEALDDVGEDEEEGGENDG